MQPSDMLTPHHMLHDSQRQVRTGFRQCWADFARSEPDVAEFIVNEAMRICGKLAFTGATSQTLRGVHEDMRRLTLTVLMATRRGQYELWKDTLMGSRLADLWQSIAETDRKDDEEPSFPTRPHHWRDDGP